MPKTALVLSYAACGTCKKVLAWFMAHGVAVTVRRGPSSRP